MWIRYIQINRFILINFHFSHSVVYVLGFVNQFHLRVIIAAIRNGNRLIARGKIGLSTLSLVSNCSFCLHTRSISGINVTRELAAVIMCLVYSPCYRCIVRSCSIVFLFTHLRTIHPFLFILN